MALLLAAVIWGSSFLIVKNTVDSMPAHYLLVFRFSIGTALLAIAMRKKLIGISKKTIKYGVFMGLILFAGYSMQTLGVSTMALGAHATTAGKSAFLSCLYCILTPFVLWLLDKKRPDRYSIAAAFLCILGIGILVLSAEKMGILAGDLFMLCSALASAFHIVLLSRYLKFFDVMQITIVQFITVAVIALAIALVSEPFPRNIPPSAWGSTVFLGVFCTAIALGLQNFGQKYAHPNSTAILLSLEGPFGVLFAVAFGGPGEQLTLRSVVGFAIILCAIIISETKLKFRALILHGKSTTPP